MIVGSIAQSKRLSNNPVFVIFAPQTIKAAYPKNKIYKLNDAVNEKLPDFFKENFGD